MKKSNQTGNITPLQAVIVLLIVAVVGFVIYRITQTKDDAQQSDSITIESQQKEEAEPTPSQPDVDIVTELESPIVISRVEDLSKLPDSTPASFIEFLKVEITDSAYSAGESDSGCIAIYTVSKISSVNISGGTGSVDPATLESSDLCGGGAGIVWYLDSSNSWNTRAYQQTLLCSDIISKNIYAEFYEECIESIDDAGKTTVPNPNGSIYDAI
jgi:hypothetical protein